MVGSDEPVLLGILLQLVFDSANNALNFLGEQIKQHLRGDLSSILRSGFVQLLLLLDQLHDDRVVVLELVGRLSIIQIDKHVGQVAPELCLRLMHLLS